MGSTHEAQKRTKVGVKKAMEMFQADQTLSKQDIVTATGLDPDVAVRAMKLVASGVAPEEMSALGTSRACSAHKLPRLLKTLLKGTDAEFERRKDLTLNASKGWTERRDLKACKEREGDTIPLARELDKTYCSMTKGLPPEMDKNGIISVSIILDPKSGCYFRRTVRLVTDDVMVGTTSNRNMMKEIFYRE
jgi:hypothetical protein